MHSYVAGGCGDEHTQRLNLSAFRNWGILPRMLNGAYERDVTVTRLPGVGRSPPLEAPQAVADVLRDQPSHRA